MAVKDQVHNVSPEEALAPQTISSDTDTNGATHEHGDFQSVWFLGQVGNYTDGDYEFKLQHADAKDDGTPDTWNDVPDADIQGGANGVTLSTSGWVKLGYRGIKPHVRLVVTSTNTSTGATVAGMCIRGHAREAPFTERAVT